MAEKLLLIRARDYLPDDSRWQGFRVDEYRCIIITPEGRQFSPKELDSWAVRFHALKRLYELDHIPVRSNVVTPLPFCGDHRVKEAKSDTVTKEEEKEYRRVMEERKMAK